MRKGKPQSNSIGRHLIKFDSIALRKEFVKVRVGVVLGISAELVMLHETDECRVELEIVILDRRANNR